MKTTRVLIWKEVRPLLPWALAGMGVVGLGLAWAMAMIADRGFVGDGGPGILAEEVRIALCLASAAVGLLLGILAMAFELSPDRWALLVHRPVSRSVLFAGKLGAALGLYFMATLVPFVVLTLWTAMPGHVAGPFYWRMTLPGLAAIGCGVAFVLAAMIAIRREARWIGSRVLPMAISVILLVMNLNVWEWWSQRGLIYLSMGAGLIVLLLGAWATFCADGQYIWTRLPGRLTLGPTLLIGVVAVGGMAVGLVTVFLPSTSYTRISHMLTSDGEIWRQVWRDGRLMEVVDLKDERPIALGDLPLESFERRDWGAKTATLFWQQIDEPWRADAVRGRAEANPMFRVLGRFGEQQWYYLMNERRLVGYWQRDEVRSRIGTMGSEGFRPAGEGPAAGFDGPVVAFPSSIGVLATSSRVYRINYVYQRSCELIWQAEEGEKIVDARPFVVGEPKEPLPVAVLSSKAIVILGSRNDQVLSVPLAHEPGAFDWVALAWIGDDDGQFVVRYRSMSGLLAKGATPSTDYFHFYDARTGAATREIEVPSLVTYRDTALYERAGEHVLAPLAVLAANVGTHVIGNQPLVWGVGVSLWWLGLTLGIAALSAVLNGLMARRLAFGRWRVLLWAALGLVFGVWGVLWMLCMVERPAREICAECGKKRVVTRKQCETCGSPWPPLPRDGREILV